MQIAPENSTKITRFLVRLTYTKDDLLRCQATEALGLVSAIISDNDPEEIRDLIRRFLWTMTEESGTVNYGAPEAVAEIIYNRPQLYADLAPMMITAAIDEAVFQRGMLWAIGRLAGQVNYILEIVPKIISFLDSPNPTLRGYAAWALGEIGIKHCIDQLNELNDDNNLLNIYINGKLHQKTVGELAELAKVKILN